MVRSHSHLLSKRGDAKLEDVDPDEVDRIWRLVAAMREEGVYTTISPYWAVSTKWRPSLGLHVQLQLAALIGLCLID